MQGYIEIDQEMCKGCQVCLTFCTRAAISLHTKVNAAGYIPAAFKQKDSCNGCGVCAIVCPEAAIEVYRE